MHINLEAPSIHAVQAYSDTIIQINSIGYERSVIVSSKEIITDFSLHSIQDMNKQYVDALLSLDPEIIIIGHKNSGVFPPLSIISDVSQRGIGMECMTLGAACRTYNVLLSEDRAVVAGFIL